MPDVARAAKAIIGMFVTGAVILAASFVAGAFAQIVWEWFMRGWDW